MSLPREARLCERLLCHKLHGFDRTKRDDVLLRGDGGRRSREREHVFKPSAGGRALKGECSIRN